MGMACANSRLSRGFFLPTYLLNLSQHYDRDIIFVHSAIALQEPARLLQRSFYFILLHMKPQLKSRVGYFHLLLGLVESHPGSRRSSSGKLQACGLAVVKTQQPNI